MPPWMSAVPSCMGKHRVYSTYKFTSGRARNPQSKYMTLALDAFRADELPYTTVSDGCDCKEMCVSCLVASGSNVAKKRSLSMPKNFKILEESYWLYSRFPGCLLTRRFYGEREKWIMANLFLSGIKQAVMALQNHLWQKRVSWSLVVCQIAGPYLLTSFIASIPCHTVRKYRQVWHSSG